MVVKRPQIVCFKIFTVGNTPISRASSFISDQANRQEFAIAYLFFLQEIDVFAVETLAAIFTPSTDDLFRRFFLFLIIIILVIG